MVFSILYMHIFKYYVHDEHNIAKVNDVVHFVLSSPISKINCFRLVNLDKFNNNKIKIINRYLWYKMKHI